MKAARETTTAISHGLNFGRQGSAGGEDSAPGPPEGCRMGKLRIVCHIDANPVILRDGPPQLDARRRAASQVRSRSLKVAYSRWDR